MVFYDINDNTELRLFYFGRSNQPSTNQLMAVADNSDPLNLSFGNPSLFPYFNHDLRSEFSYSNKKSFFTLRATVEGSMVQDPIVSAVWYDRATGPPIPRRTASSPRAISTCPAITTTTAPSSTRPS